MSDETTVTNEVPGAVVVWYKNATLWTNIVVCGGLILTSYCGVTVDPKLQAGLLAIVNIVLRTPQMATTQAKAIMRNKAIRERMMVR